MKLDDSKCVGECAVFRPILDEIHYLFIFCHLAQTESNAFYGSH